MSDPFVAEIRIFGFNFAPRAWATCDGQLVPIAQNTALFSLLGTTYGGNGTTTYALPNLQGRAAMHFGQAPGLANRDLGETGGQATVSLTMNEMPVHTHSVSVAAAADAVADRSNAAGNVWARGADSSFAATGALTPMSPASTSVTGNGAPHNNMQPYLTLNFCIALQGIFPPRQ